MGLFTTDQPTIKIMCEGAFVVGIDELHELQGDLKESTEDDYKGLRQSLIDYGFRFPYFIWEDKFNDKWIVDAHRRKATMMRMRSEEGFIIPKLPAVRIFAKDRTEAKELILLQENKYGRITKKGFDHFMHEPNFEIDMPKLEPYKITIPQIQISLPDLDNQLPEPAAEPKTEEVLTCPKCEHTGKKKDFIK